MIQAMEALCSQCLKNIFHGVHLLHTSDIQDISWINNRMGYLAGTVAEKEASTKSQHGIQKK